MGQVQRDDDLEAVGGYLAGRGVFRPPVEDVDDVAGGATSVVIISPMAMSILLFSIVSLFTPVLAQYYRT